MPFLRNCAIATISAVWLGTVVFGFAVLQREANKPGAMHTPPPGATDWLKAHKKAGRALAVLVVHPLCPCSDASLSEFGDFLARSAGKCDAILVEFEPEQVNERDQWPTLSPKEKLGGVEVPIIGDRGGRIADLLGAATSGHLIMVDENGVVRFYGGITLARGHRGTSPVQNSMLAILRGDQNPIQDAPVYGCSLKNPARGKSL